MIMSECTPRMTQFPSGPYDDQTAQWLHGVGSIRQRTRPPSIIIVINWRINSIIIQGTRLNYLPESFLAKGRQCVTHHPRILTDRKASQPARQVLSRVTCVARRVAGQSMRLSPKSPPEIDGERSIGSDHHQNCITWMDEEDDMWISVVQGLMLKWKREERRDLTQNRVYNWE